MQINVNNVKQTGERSTKIKKIYISNWGKNSHEHCRKFMEIRATVKILNLTEFQERKGLRHFDLLQLTCC